MRNASSCCAASASCGADCRWPCPGEAGCYCETAAGDATPAARSWQPPCHTRPEAGSAPERLLSRSSEVHALTSFVLLPQHFSKHFWPPNKNLIFLPNNSLWRTGETHTNIWFPRRWIWSRNVYEAGSMVCSQLVGAAQDRKAEYVTQGLTDFVAELNCGTIWFMHKDSCNLNIALNGEKWKGRIYLKAPWFLQSNGLP